MRRVLAIDVGATKTASAIWDGKNLSGMRTYKTPQKAKQLPPFLNRIFASYPRASSIGIGIPGFVQNGIVSGLPNLGFSGPLPLAKILAKASGANVFVENDVKCAALAEIKYGLAKGKSSAILAWPGSGIGGALIIDGRIISGASHSAGEFGHMKINSGINARKCGCGARGCFEAYAGGRGIEKAYAAKFKIKKSAKEIFTSNNKKDSTFAKDAAYLFGVGLASLANALNPEIIIVGGSLSHAYLGKYKKTVLSSFAENAIPPAVRTKIVKSRLSNAALLGAGMMTSR